MLRSHSRRPGSVSVPKSRGERCEVERVARWPRRQPRQVRAALRVLRGRSAGFPRGEARTGRAARGAEALVTRLRTRGRRPGAVSVRRSLGQRRGVERVARWPRRQPRQVRQRACAPWAVSRFCTGRSAHGSRDTVLRIWGHDAPKPQPSAWHGVGAEEPWPTAWGGARRALAAKTTTPSPPARVCSVAGRPVLHGAKRARAVRHGARKLWSQGSEAAAVGLARCRCGGALANGVGWSASRVGREDNHAKSASARVLRGRLAGSARVEARAGRATRYLESGVTMLRSHSRRPGSVSVPKSRGERCGVERVARWPRRQPRQVRAALRVLRGRSAGFPRGEARTGRAARGSETVVTRLRTRGRRPGAVSVRRSLGQRRGVERVARWPRRQPRQVRQRACAPWAVSRFCTGRSAHGSRDTVLRICGHDAPKPQPSAWRGVGAEEPWPTAWGGARRALAAKTTTPSPPAHVCSVAGRSVLHGAKRARAVRHGARKLWTLGSEAAAVGLARCRCGGALANGVGWSASLVGREDNHAKSASARVLRGRLAGSARVEARAGRATRYLESRVTMLRSHSRRPGSVSVPKSRGERCGMERVARWPRRQPRQVRAALRVLRGRSAGFPRGEARTGRAARGAETVGHKASNPRPSAWRGVGAEEPWPTAWGGARRALAAKTTTPSPPARVCSVGG